MNMKKAVAGLLVLGLLASSGIRNVQAALEDYVTVTVTIQYLSVEIDPSVGFGSLQLNQSAVSSVLYLTNNGNVTERFALRGNIAGSDWTMGDVNGDNQMVLYALFRGESEAAPITDDFTVGIDTISVNDKEVPTSGDGAFCDADPGDGQNVASQDPRQLYLMILTPTADASNGAEQTLFLTITALAQ